tara:strand:+ start:93 stop:386 length:294 start_codon:yes stop_codon:yes gene_type:complete
MRAKRRCMHGKRIRKPGAPKIGKAIDKIQNKAIVETVKGGLTRFGKKNLARILGRVAAPVSLAMGAKDIFDGYGDLAKNTKHGKQIIKDARMMPGKM